MAISRTRMKFLDKENKILIQDLKKIVSNKILSDVLTPLLESDLFAQFQGVQVLLDLQANLSEIYSVLSDITISDFTVKKILNNLVLTDPALSHIAATLELIKSMDEKSVGVFIATLLEVTADKLYDNPSLIHNYKGVTSDVQTQLLLVAIDIYGTRISSGELNLSSVSKILKNRVSGLEGVDSSVLNTLLGKISFTSPGYDVNAQVQGTYEIPEGFYDTGSESGEYEGVFPQDADTDIDAGTDGVITAQKLLIAYVSMKRDMHKYYRTFADYHQAGDWLDSEERVAEADDLFVFPKAQEGEGFITLLHTHDSFVSFLRNRVDDALRVFSKASNAADHSKVFGHTVSSLIKSLDSAIHHPYINGFKDDEKAIIPDLSKIYNELKVHLLDNTFAFRTGDGPLYPPTAEFNGVLERITQEMLVLIDKAVSAHFEKHKIRDPETLCIPALYVQYRAVLDLLKFVQGTDNEMILAALAATVVSLTNPFSLRPGKLCAAAGFDKDKALFGYHVSDQVQSKQASLYDTMDAHYTLLQTSESGIDKELKNVLRSIYAYRNGSPYGADDFAVVQGGVANGTAHQQFLTKGDYNTREWAYTMDVKGVKTPVEPIQRNTSKDCLLAIDLYRLLFSSTDIKII